MQFAPLRPSQVASRSGTQDLGMGDNQMDAET